MYCFEGNESNIYVAKDVEVEIRVDGGKWERVKLTGSLREPSATLNMPNEGKHVVEVRAINEEIALNMISTDGVFYKGQAPKSNPPVIHGADNIKIGVGQVATFDKMKRVSYSNDIDTTGLQINVTGELGEPTPGTNKEYTLTYTVTDSDKNTVIVPRKVIVLKNNVDNEVKPEETPDAPDAPGETPDVKPEAPIVSENTSGNQHQSSNITLQQSNKVNTLPATGNVVGSSLLASIGGLLAGVGIKLSKKKRK